MRALREIAEENGISYRQANYWVSEGYVRASWFGREGEELPEGKGGQGHLLKLDAIAQAHFVTMARLVKAGFSPEPASKIAALLTAGARDVKIGEDLYLARGPIFVEADADATI